MNKCYRFIRNILFHYKIDVIGIKKELYNKNILLYTENLKISNVVDIM